MLPLITTFGLGYMRPASGTWGSLPPIIIAALLWFAGISPASTHSWAPIAFNAIFIAILLLFAFACVRFGDAAEAKFGHDPKEVVADETSGQCVPLIALPACAFDTWQHAAITLTGAFLLFRIMDIIKPWPAYGLQKLPAGWGILLDDLMAAIYAALLLQVSVRLLLCA